MIKMTLLSTNIYLLSRRRPKRIVEGGIEETFKIKYVSIKIDTYLNIKDFTSKIFTTEQRNFFYCG